MSIVEIIKIAKIARFIGFSISISRIRSFE